ncbi:MAG: pyridoxine 5'-phosphate synthase [Stenotrophobium sp.]
MTETIRLGVNVDHVATVRQARGTAYPDPVEAALLAASAGADSITVHLREDRRHIQDRDVSRLLKAGSVPVNLEMAVDRGIVAFACRNKPRYACLVPERREEVTTEGGLDVAGQQATVTATCLKLARAGIAVALFVDPDLRQLDAVVATRAPHLEIHTGRYADSRGAVRSTELKRIRRYAQAAHRTGLEVHAGHGLTLENVGPIAAIPEITELNIGHSIIARALFVGLPAAVAEMRRAMTVARGA